MKYPEADRKYAAEAWEKSQVGKKCLETFAIDITLSIAVKMSL